jgi:glycosyltransferase involved in cell wall biosynthesis
MKILEVCRSYFPSIGGLEKFVSNRIKIYKDLNHDYHVLTTTYSTKIPREIIGYDNVTYFNQYTKYNYAPDLDKNILNDYDIISVNQIGNYLSDFCILYASRRKKKIVLTPHLYFHTKEYDLFKRIHKNYLLPKLLKKADRIICFTNVEMDYWNKNFNVSGSKLIKIPHYIRDEVPGNLCNKSTGGKFLFYLGRYYKNKRVDLIIEAFHSVNQLDIDLLLTISLGDLNTELKKIVKADSRIKLLGTISEEQKEEYLRSCEAIIYPSTFEAFGTVLLEASVFSKPILCSSLPVFREILDPGGAIFFRNDINSVYKAIIEFIQKPASDKLKMGEINYLNCKKYSYKKIKYEYEILFNNLFA